MSTIHNQLVVVSSKFIAMDHEQKVSIYNIENECVEKTFDLSTNDHSWLPVRIFAFLENFNFLHGYYHAGKPWLNLIDYATGAVMQTFLGHTEAIKSVHILPGGDCFVSGSFRQIKIWNFDTGACVRSILNDEFHHSKCLILTPRGRLVNLSPEDSLSIWNTLVEFKWMGEYRYPDFKPTYKIKPLTIDGGGGGGDRIMSYYNDRRVHVWDLNEGKCLNVLDQEL